MSKIELTDEELEERVKPLLPWSPKRYKNGRRDVQQSMFEDGEVHDWMTRLYTKKIVVLLQHGYSRREVAYRLGCHRHTVEMVATGRCWHHREPVYIEPHLRPKPGRKPSSNRPDKVKDNQLTFTDEQVTMLINEAKELMLEGSERRVRIKFPPMGEPPVGFPRAMKKQKTTTNSADFWPKWREYTPLSVLTYFSKLGKLKLAVERYYETVGKKKHILAIDGRFVSVRGKNVLLSCLGQGLGAICMSYAACLMDTWLGNLYLDDLGRPYYLYKNHIVRRISMIHDEYSWEVEDGVQEEIKEMSVKAIIKAGEYLKLSLPLNGEGKLAFEGTWKDVH